MEVRQKESAETIRACRERIEKEAHYLTQELWLQRDSHTRMLEALALQQGEVEQSCREAQDWYKRQQLAAQAATEGRMEDERRREEMREEQARLERRNLQSSKAANAAAALLEAELKEAMRSDKERLADLKRAVMAEEEITAKLQAQLREDQAYLSEQREVLSGLASMREAEHAAELKGIARRREDRLSQIRQTLAARVIQQQWRVHWKAMKRRKKGKGKKPGQANGSRGKKTAILKPGGTPKKPGASKTK